MKEELSLVIKYLFSAAVLFVVLAFAYPMVKESGNFQCWLFCCGVVCLVLVAMLSLLVCRKCEQEKKLKEQIDALEKKVDGKADMSPINQDEKDAKLRRHEEILALIKTIGKMAENSGCNLCGDANTANYKDLVESVKKMIES